MEVILLEKVGRMGNVGDKVNVRSGYARNFLFPYSKAIPATKDNLADFEARKAELLRVAAEKLATAEARAAAIGGVLVTISANAGDEGKLFGSVGTRDIAEALSAAGHAVEKSEVLLPDGALRDVGEYDIDLSLGSEVNAVIKLSIVAQK
ncbi:MAG: 50S ribosomal protein L9 [Pseudomonadales bacterium]|jgi:large subunit ribosomal protein L9|nr:50S ribosomal protein L9 [Pseudomonadales bacterium]